MGKPYKTGTLLGEYAGELIRDAARLDFLQRLCKVGLSGEAIDTLAGDGMRDRIDDKMADKDLQATLASRT